MNHSQLQFEPLSGTFGAVVHGVHLATLDAADFQLIYDSWLKHALLIFPGQFLTREQQIAFARKFGELEFDIAAISNVKDDGSLRDADGNDEMMQVIRGNMTWHHDSTYMRVQAKGAVFSAEVVPNSGGATGFADMRAAYDALDATLRTTIENMRAHHSLYHSQAKLGHHGKRGSHNLDFESTDGYTGYGFHDGPVSVRKLVKTHPETGRKNLLVGRHAYDVEGLDEQESEALLTKLNTFAVQDDWTYHHQWQPGDVLLWDNRCLMHRATEWPMDQPRVMWHSRIAGDEASEAAYPAQ